MLLMCTLILKFGLPFVTLIHHLRPGHDQLPLLQQPFTRFKLPLSFEFDVPQFDEFIICAEEVGAGSILVFVSPLNSVDFLGNLGRVEGVEGCFEREELSQVVELHSPAFLHALEDDDPAASVPHRQVATLLVEGY